MAEQQIPQTPANGASTEQPGQNATGALDAGTLAAQLAQTPGADAWQVQVIREQEAQLYIIGAQVESRRTVTNERARLRLLNDHPPHAAAPSTPPPDQPPTAAEEDASAPTEPPPAPQPVRGWTTLTLLAAEARDTEQVAARLRDGVFMAGLTDNQPYDLPAPPPAGFPAVAVADPALTASEPGAMERALEAARATLEAAVAAEPGVRLSSAELYATRESLRLRNSNGLTASSEGTRVFLDVMLIARDETAGTPGTANGATAGGGAEMHVEMARRRLVDLDLRGTIAAYAAYARDTLRAQTPATFRGPVVISGAALPDLLSPLIFHTSAQAAFLGISSLKLGQPITSEEPRGDRISLASDALYPFGTRSAPFDAEGVPATRVALVVDGVLRAQWAEQRYAHYLGVPATGAFATTVVEAGKWPAAELVTAGPVYEIVEFSWMNPDPISGDFASEIRLGYRHDPDGSVVPIKGGTLSGNLFQALADVRLSHETQFTGAYAGPAAMRFGQLTIAGE